MSVGIQNESRTDVAIAGSLSQAPRPMFIEEAAESPISAHWDIARDEKASPESRFEAVQELIQADNDVSAFIASELERDDLIERWRDLVVFLAEDLQFPAAIRRNIGERLLVVASAIRKSPKVGANKVAWAALRRAATLLPGEPSRFLCFLDRHGVVDTRSVALRCIQRVFETSPPADIPAEKDVADRVADFADKFLDPDVFASGENALIAQNAIFALATLGDDRLDRSVDAAARLNRRWMNRQLATGLADIVGAWRANDSDGRLCPAMARIDRQIGKLKQYSSNQE